MRQVALLLSSLALVASDTVLWDLEKVDQAAHLHRRGDTLEAELMNKKNLGAYFVKVQIGDPGQKFTLIVDTGSSDTWVPHSECPICEEHQCDWGSFNPEHSQTYRTAQGSLFAAHYADGSYARGNYFSDDFAMDDAVVKGLTMGLGMNTTTPHGIVGLGYAINEASVGSRITRYPNLPLAMEQGGLINSVAYSLWLNDLSASKGNILFGGLDTSKYVGNMTRVPVLKDPILGIYDHFRVALTSVTASSPSGIDALTSLEFPIPVVLDSGSTISYLPDDVSQQIWREVGATYDPDFDAHVLPCSYANNEGHFSFGFAGENGPRINITMDELVITVITGGKRPVFEGGPHNGQDLCLFGFQNATGPSVWLLGDTFLRSAYVVYDLVNDEIGLAATDFNSTESNIVAFKSSGAPIPSATAVSNKESVTATANGTSSATETATPTGKLKAADGFQNDDNDSGTAGTSLSVVMMLFCAAVGMTFLP